MLYVGVSFQVNRSLEMTSDIGQNRLYEFCYLLPFHLWTFFWQRSFSYEDVIACFGNLLVLEGSLR
jgi:hypothetical protein